MCSSIARVGNFDDAGAGVSDKKRNTWHKYTRLFEVIILTTYCSQSSSFYCLKSQTAKPTTITDTAINTGVKSISIIASLYKSTNVLNTMHTIINT